LTFDSDFGIMLLLIDGIYINQLELYFYNFSMKGVPMNWNIKSWLDGSIFVW